MIDINERKICYEILYKYENEGAYLNLALKQGLSHAEPSQKGFCTEAVYGVVRNRLFLDAKISEYSKIKLKKLSLPVLVILRLALYELYFMESGHDYAVINESVKLAKKYAYKSSGFINGVLRSACERREKAYPDNIKYSFPDSIYNKICAQYGENAPHIFKELNEKKPVSIRQNALKISKDELIRLLGGNCTEEYGRLFVKGGIDTEYFKKGFFSVSGAASQGAVEALSPQKDEKILDCCAAPGGKTAYIAEIMGNTSEITAMELHPHRCELIKENLKRLGITNTSVKCHDASAKIDEFCGYFDRVICDAPCSGWGVIPTKPDIKWRETDTKELAKIQKKILETVALYVKHGGILVYCTCTINKEENEEITDEFLRKNPEFEPISFEINIDGEIFGADGRAVILPEKNHTGFYICKLKRRGKNEK